MTQPETQAVETIEAVKCVSCGTLHQSNAKDFLSVQVKPEDPQPYRFAFGLYRPEGTEYVHILCRQTECVAPYVTDHLLAYDQGYEEIVRELRGGRPLPGENEPSTLFDPGMLGHGFISIEPIPEMTDEQRAAYEQMLADDDVPLPELENIVQLYAPGADEAFASEQVASVADAIPLVE